jgi:hypothetical protein
MKLVVLSLASLIACQGDPAPKPLDPQDPRSVLDHAARNTRGQKSYETKFKARLAAPKSDPLDYDGRCVWVAPGVLYTHYTATGGDEKNIVRAGPSKAWVYHPLVKWTTADEAGMPGAGRGVQNPDEVLGVLAKGGGTLKLLRPGAVELTFTGDDIESIMKEQAQQGAFQWKDSTAVVELETDAQNRVRKFSVRASLKSSDPKVTGAVEYAAQVEIVDYNQATELKFYDDKKREIPLKPAMKEAIETVLKEKK